jgi:hypothetical protein
MKTRRRSDVNFRRRGPGGTAPAAHLEASTAVTSKKTVLSHRDLRLFDIGSPVLVEHINVLRWRLPEECPGGNPIHDDETSLCCIPSGAD